MLRATSKHTSTGPSISVTIRNFATRQLAAAITRSSPADLGSPTVPSSHSEPPAAAGGRGSGRRQLRAGHAADLGAIACQGGEGHGDVRRGVHHEEADIEAGPTAERGTSKGAAPSGVTRMRSALSDACPTVR